MKLHDVLYGVGVREMTADPDTDVKDVVNSSDACAPGAVFAAMTGEHASGADHIKDAIGSGCAAVLCEKRPDTEVPYIISDNVRADYARMCANINGSPEKKLKLCAVTGTNGKTTVTSMLYHIIKTVKGEKSAALTGGVKNIICGRRYKAVQTTPDPHELYRLYAEAVRGGAEYAVSEISSHALSYEKAAPCRFSVGAFTNLTEDHLDYHGSMAEYFDAKKKLIALCDEFVSNGDDPYTKQLDTKKFSLYEGDFTAEIYELSDKGTVFLYSGVKSAVCRLKTIGKFNVYNALTAMSMAELVGFEARDAAEALSDFAGAAGRFERHLLKNGALVIIDYAHTPDALENALRTARAICRGKLICVFGCGGDRDRGKRRIMGGISSKYADMTVVTSDNSRGEEPEKIISDIMSGVDKNSRHTVAVDRREAIMYALSCAKKNDIVLLCGKGHEDYEIDKRGKHAFSEIDIIREFDHGGI